MKTQKTLFAILLAFFMATGLHAQTSKEYTVDQIADFQADLVAGVYDTLVLSTSGGIYNLETYSSISTSTVIMGKEGLAEQPVLKRTNNTGNGAGIFLATGADITIVYENLAFDGTIVEGTNTVSALRANSKIDMIVNNCHFENFTDNNGVFRLNAGGSTIDLRNSVIANSKQRLIHLYTPDEVYGHVHVENCTFVNIDGPVIFYRAAGGITAIGTTLTVNHSTFYNVNGGADGIIRGRNNAQGDAKVHNSMFFNITAATPLANSIVVDVDYCYVEGMDPEVAGTNLFTATPVFADADNWDFAIVNADEFICGDGEVVGNLNYYSNDEPDDIILTFNVVSDGVSVTDAVITLSGEVYDPGHYVFPVEEGTFAYRVDNEPGYIWRDGSVVVTESVTVTVEIAPRKIYEAKPVSTPLVIGADNDAIWDVTASSAINVLNQQLLGELVDLNSEGTIKALYDSEFLYLRADVLDDVLVPGDNENWKTSVHDDFEMYIHGANSFSRTGASGSRPRFEIGKYQMAFGLGLDSLRGWGEGDGADGTIHDFTMMYQYGVQWVQQATDNGYMVEARLPWLAVFEGSTEAVEALAPGDYVSVNFNIRDVDVQADGLKSQVVWADHPYETTQIRRHPFWGSQHWGVIQLLADMPTVVFNVVDTLGHSISGAVISINNVPADPGNYIFPLAAGTYNYSVSLEPDYVWRGGSFTVESDDLTVNVELAPRHSYHALYIPVGLEIGNSTNSEIWSSVLPEPVEKLNQLLGTDLSSKGNFRALYDKAFLYIYAEVEDDVVIGGNPEDWKAGGGDELEVYIDGKNGFKNPGPTGSRPRFDPGKYQMSFGLGLDSLRGWGEGTGADGTVHDFTMMYEYGVQWVQQPTAYGYNLEARIPWMAVYQGDLAQVEALEAGDYVSMNFNIRDYDVFGTLNSQVVWEDHPYQTSQLNNHPFWGSQHWPVMVLSPDTVDALPQYNVVFNITDSDGAAITDARVQLGFNVNDPGNYSFSVIAGEYTWKITKAGYYTQEGVITITEDVNIDITLVAIPTYTVTFIVKDQLGNDLPDAVITFAGVAYTAGHYVIDGVYPGTYVYFASYLDEMLAGNVEVVDADITRNLVFTVDDTSVADLNGLIFNMYPNPLYNSELIIEFPSGQELMTVRVIDIRGALVYETDQSKDRVTLSRDQFNQGLYLIQLINNNYSVTRKLIVK
jgi:hypothetical protein